MDLTLSSRNRRRRKLSFADYQTLEPRNLLATLFSDTFESFTGAGFTSSPSAGQLDSDSWQVNGLSDGDTSFGGTFDSGDYARGESSGGVFSGGIYSFDVGSNRTFGVQPTGADMTPGSITLRVENTTGAAVDDWSIAYDLWYLNDGDRGNSANLSYSVDGTSFTNLASADFSTPITLDGNGWATVVRDVTVTEDIAAGSFIYFRWSIEDAGGSGNRDEISFDNLIVETDGGGGIVNNPATDNLRIVSYNVLNRPQSNGAESDFDTVFSAIGVETAAGVTRQIDLVALQETDEVSLDRIESVFDDLYVEDYVSVISQNDSGDWFGFVYNSETLDLLETEILSGPYTRDPFRGLFHPVGAVGSDSDFHAYSVHLNATNSNTRLTEANALKADIDALGNNTNVLLLGDLNIDSSSENSYQSLLSSGNGQLFDPINAPGTWNNNNSFKAIHTQDPGGQMDDRFDFQLVTDEVRTSGGLEYIGGSYRAFGNNGTHNINQNITTGSGASTAVLNALVGASDHLPVVADYRFDIPSASIANPQLFYNGSSFDGSNDIDAVTGKIALLPGQTATFDNYTSYVRGINGIVVETNDLFTVPTLGTIGDFFEFRVGNDNAVGAWATAPAPNGVVYQADVDASGTDLVFLTWADNAIENTWLQTTTLANTTTGFTTANSFYFGNAIAEVGDNAANAQVNLVDVGLTRSNQTGFSSATIDNVYDFDRDGRVNLVDVGLARANQTGFSSLDLITPPASSARGDYFASDNQDDGKKTESQSGRSVQDFSLAVFNDTKVDSKRSLDDAFKTIGFNDRGRDSVLAGSVLRGSSDASTEFENSKIESKRDAGFESVSLDAPAVRNPLASL